MFVCIFDEEKIVDLLWINVCPSSMRQQLHATRKEGWWYCSLHALVKNTSKNDNLITTIIPFVIFLNFVLKSTINSC